jgi:polyribonucleotide nucleotidyltransferase
MNAGRIEVPFGTQNLILETGKLAKQANAAVLVTYGGTVVLVTACMAKKPKPDADFFPLMVEYQEKTYSAGRIPGGFFKREGRPTQREILTSRVIDRPIRPLFPEGFLNEVQVVATVLSSDGENDPDIIAIIGASAALTISDIPFNGPIGAIRIGMINGQFVINPTYAQRTESTMDLTVVGLSDGIVMIEGESNEVPESKMEEALQFAFEQLQVSRKVQLDFQKQVGQPKAVVDLIEPHPGLKQKVEELSKKRLVEAYKIGDKLKREEAVNAVYSDLVKDFSIYDEYKIDGLDIGESDIKMLFEYNQYAVIRHMVFQDKKRADGRGLKEIRPISCEVNVLPRTHGSSLFTRGQTQSLAVVTLGTKRDEQLIEDLEGVSYNNFMLHYNFPSFSVGETKPMRGPGRREIGHGALAAKALKCILPEKEKFPYTIRVVSEILESNGSSSMASVCAGCLSLMAAGVPIREMVAGISIGVMTEGHNYTLITDIMGLEDHFGDMDFKVAGTEKGITAIQLDLKIQGVSMKLLKEACEQAREARLKILENMRSVISKPLADISKYAPRIITTQVPIDKIGEVIGPGGKTIKKIIEETGVETIDIEEDGTVLIASMSKEAADKALAYVNGLVEVPEVGKIYDAKVSRVTNFGAFCEFLPGKSGLVHVSEFSNEYVKDLTTVVKVGDEFKVKLVEIDQMKRMNLSKKQADAEVNAKS